MKYLIPLINSNDLNNSAMGNINLKFHYNNMSPGNRLGTSVIRRHLDDTEIRKIVHNKGILRGNKNSYSLNSSTDLPRIQISKNFS